MYSSFGIISHHHHHRITFNFHIHSRNIGSTNIMERGKERDGYLCVVFVCKVKIQVEEEAEQELSELS